MIKNGFIAGIAVLILALLSNFFVSILVPTVAREYQNPNIFRPWQDPLMMAFFAYPFILGLVAAYLWSLLKEHLKGNALIKAFQFAKIYFIIATIPGMFITFTTFKLSYAIVLVWAISGLLEAFVVGLVLAKVVKE
ncbi:MAG: hypothetical protein M1365_00825 [Actinobacteria bacterium]|nr:hypothetical protein [Actinomycetota bacterium]